MSGAASGVAVDEACVQAFMDIKRKRAHRFVLYKVGACAARAAPGCAATLQRAADASLRRADDAGKKIIIETKSAPTVRERAAPRARAFRLACAPSGLQGGGGTSGGRVARGAR